MALIEAQQLSKFYGKFSAIQQLNFQVESGSITAFLGPNGAGKSTTLKILTGFLAPSEGTARIAGFDMCSERLAGSAQLGYVSEFAPLYPDMHVHAYLAYIGKLRRLHGNNLRTALEKVCVQCQLAEVWKKNLRKLSKGFRQRIALAQAIIHQPRVLILDEPSAGLDPNQIIMMREFISNFAAEDKAVLLSTHILQEVEALADHALVIHHGRIQFDGPTKDLLEHGIEQEFRKITHGEVV